MLVSHLMEGYRLICCLPTTTEGWWRKGGLIAKHYANLNKDSLFKYK